MIQKRTQNQGLFYHTLRAYAFFLNDPAFSLDVDGMDKMFYNPFLMAGRTLQNIRFRHLAKTDAGRKLRALRDKLYERLNKIL